jgi:peptide subunit release factor 1 (eRF1)
MVEYIVSKTRANINNQVYEKGDKVELSDEEALHLLSQGVVISDVSTQLPTESDGLFEEIRKENVKLKEVIEQQKGIIARFTDELNKKDEVIANLKTRKK